MNFEGIVQPTVGEPKGPKYIAEEIPNVIYFESDNKIPDKDDANNPFLHGNKINPAPPTGKRLKLQKHHKTTTSINK